MRHEAFVVKVISIGTIVFFSYCSSCDREFVSFTNDVSDHIIIVNTSNGDRGVILETLKKVKSFKPKIIGIDYFFSDEIKTEYDQLLSRELNDDKIVIAHYMEIVGDSVIVKLPSKVFYQGSNVYLGHVALNQNEDGLITHWYPFLSTSSETYPHFAYMIAEFYRWQKVYNKIGAGHKKEMESKKIIYRRSIDQYVVKNRDDLDMSDSLLFKNKIVLIGYTDGQEDMHFTPMRGCIGSVKDEADTQGIVILANIISDLIDD